MVSLAVADLATAEAAADATWAASATQQVAAVATPVVAECSVAAGFAGNFPAADAAAVANSSPVPAKAVLVPKFAACSAVVDVAADANCLAEENHSNKVLTTVVLAELTSQKPLDTSTAQPACKVSFLVVRLKPVVVAAT